MIFAHLKGVILMMKVSITQLCSERMKCFNRKFEFEFKREVTMVDKKWLHEDVRCR